MFGRISSIRGCEVKSQHLILLSYDKEQQFPFSLPSDQPRDDRQVIPTEVENPGRTSSASESTPTVEPHAPQFSAEMPPPEELPRPEEPAREPISSKRRGRPPVSKKQAPRLSQLYCIVQLRMPL